MILGWKDLIRRRLIPRHEFVSADARRFSTEPRTYELLSNKSTPALNIKSPDKAVLSPNSMKTTPVSPYQGATADYFGKNASAKTYISPVSSYSSPRPPSQLQVPGRDWDPRATHARGESVPGAPTPTDFTI